ncbi:hypothetical protein AB4144_47015, partial [Rhizobiaceae sp. 2RAB30]
TQSVNGFEFIFSAYQPEMKESIRHGPLGISSPENGHSKANFGVRPHDWTNAGAPLRVLTRTEIPYHYRNIVPIIVTSNRDSGE